MSCEECKKSIFIYDELTPAERSKADRHISQCEVCTTLVEEWKKQGVIIQRASSFQPMPPDKERLTGKIIASIHGAPERQEVWWNRWAHYLDLSPVRFAMGVVSLTLVVFFLIELQEDRYSTGLKVSEFQAGQGNLILNSQRFVKEFQQKKNKEAVEQTSFYDCFRQCRVSESQPDCDQCKVQISKWLRKYESI